MIIVSQNKREIYNLEKISGISIGQNCHQSINEEDFTYDIYIEGVRSIGSYPSLDRAKEVLENIVEFYSLADKTGCVQPLEALALAKVREHSIIYMPEK